MRHRPMLSGQHHWGTNMVHRVDEGHCKIAPHLLHPKASVHRRAKTLSLGLSSLVFGLAVASTWNASQMMPAVYLGTQGWSYPSWVGSFYPPATASSAFLAHYSKEFATVESRHHLLRHPKDEHDRRLARTDTGRLPLRRQVSPGDHPREGAGASRTAVSGRSTAGRTSGRSRLIWRRSSVCQASPPSAPPSSSRAISSKMRSKAE